MCVYVYVYVYENPKNQTPKMKKMKKKVFLI